MRIAALLLVFSLGCSSAPPEKPPREAPKPKTITERVAERTRDRLADLLMSHPDDGVADLYGEMNMTGELILSVSDKPLKTSGESIVPLSVIFVRGTNGAVQPVLLANSQFMLDRANPDWQLWIVLSHESVHLRQWKRGLIPIISPYEPMREHTEEEARKYFEMEAEATIFECKQAVQYGLPLFERNGTHAAYRTDGEDAMREQLAELYCEVGWQPLHCELFQEQARALPH